MANNNSTKVIEQRADIYKLLSLLFYQPNHETAGYLKDLKELISDYMYSGIDFIDKMEKDLEKTSANANYLLVDYARLFVGPFNVLAAPYGSLYLDNERTVMGDSTIDACRQYAEAGLEIDVSFKEAPDHIAVELEFLYYLNYRYLETNELMYLVKQGDFLHGHLGFWIDHFTKAVLKNSNTDFYVNLTVITQNFIKEDMQFLKEFADNNFSVEL
ncbi:MAG: hypothetical protein JM58_01755 [Peptococcaceae bacterium BICA1-8]|nr:MAG: hypothetical protein JM58_01755 [Peptococcaceae bacterium BICA1-8]